MTASGWQQISRLYHAAPGPRITPSEFPFSFPFRCSHEVSAPDLRVTFEAVDVGRSNSLMRIELLIVAAAAACLMTC
jgi:galactose mutarotase-like enzyme